VPSWGKIIALYTIAAAAAFGHLALGATETFSVSQLDLRGSFGERPLVGDVFLSPEHFQGDAGALFLELAAVKFERTREVGQAEAKAKAELEGLRAQHRALMMSRNGTSALDDVVDRESMESKWLMEMTQNVYRQAEWKAKLKATAGKWDEAHQLIVYTRPLWGKKFLVRAEWAESQAEDVQIATLEASADR
jgi:hypothetical protein